MLRTGQRYLFHWKAPHHPTEILFRANFVSILNQTLIINSSEQEKSPKTLVSIPYDWITKVETLENIVTDNPILPSDVLFIIDNYL